MPRLNGVSQNIAGDRGVEQGGIAVGFSQTEDVCHCMLDFSLSMDGEREHGAAAAERSNSLPEKILAKST